MIYLRDYHNFYLLTDVLLLADLLENFREVWLQHYGLDHTHNWTSPGLSGHLLLTLFRMTGGGERGAKRLLYQFSPCNFYERGN